MEDVVWERLENQIEWYDTRSARNQRAFKRLKYLEITSAAAIPVVTAFGAPGEVAAVLGALVVIVEAILHLNQFQQNWLTYRATAEALKRERSLYLAHAGPYRGVADPRALLAECVEALVSDENTKWVSHQQEAPAPAPAPERAPAKT